MPKQTSQSNHSMSFVLRVNVLVAKICRFQSQEDDITNKIPRSLTNCVTCSDPTNIPPINNACNLNAQYVDIRQTNTIQIY